MSTRPTVREVFTDVEADPDAVLEAFDVDSPEELIASGGAHGPTTDEELDATDAVADELFGDLSSVSDSLESGDGSSSAEERRHGDEGDSERSIEGTVFVTKPTVAVEPATFIDTAPENGEATTSRTHSGLALVGPKPAPIRVENESFGVDIDDAFDPVRGA